MDIDDIVMYDGRRYHLRGLDPEGVEPRFVYLEDPRAQMTFSVLFEELLRSTENDTLLHLVDDDPR